MLLYVAGAAYALAQAALGAYGVHRYALLGLYVRARVRSAASPGSPALPTAGAAVPLPVVTVQLPVHDERFVVARLIDAACALDYPRDRLEIQVLDDSTDETTALAAARVAHHRACGIDIVLLHRGGRDGYKAGALAAGLAVARGTLLAVFDADFVPPRDFLARVVGEFADPDVGMVQARWGHLNRDWSALTEAQALFLDGHFAIEHAARAGNGRFFNFNGTAGVWRRSCIEDAGGWTHDTLTEDLDLSYRAQMKGWRFVYRSDVVAPAELPADIRAFKAQQRRWAMGSIQTARKILPTLFRQARPLSIKLEAAAHLTSNAAYVLLIGSILLLGPVLVLPDTMPQAISFALLMLSFVTGMVAVVVFLLAARRAVGGRMRSALARLPRTLLLGVGMSLNNAAAVLEAFRPAGGGWERTPKDGIRSRRDARPRARYRSGGGSGAGEAALAAYLAALTVLAADRGRWGAVPFLVFLTLGFIYVAGLSWRGRSARI